MGTTEPATSTAAAATTTTAAATTQSTVPVNNFHKDRLNAYYEKHNPSKVGTVDGMLEKFKGKEEVMFQKLEVKYGENPTAVWLTAFYTKHNPSKVDSVDELVDIYKGKEEEMYHKLKAKYPEE